MPMKPSFLVFLALATAAAQTSNPATPPGGQAFSETRQPAPILHVTVISRTVQAINYGHRAGTTQIGFRGTALMPAIEGEAKVQSRMGSTKIETKLDHLSPATQFGPEYLTYVLWAITPQGRPVNLGELVLHGDDAKLLSTTGLQTFGLIVTAEPYFAVTRPSDVVVAENFVRPDTEGAVREVNANYQLLKRGEYVYNQPGYRPVQVNPKGPLQLAEAENAVEIASLAGAGTYAPDVLQTALTNLQSARYALKEGHRKKAETDARDATQVAEDARIVTARKIRDQRLAEERAAAAERAAEARARAEKAAQAREEAESARAAALAQEQQAKAEAERARAAARQAEAQRQQAELQRQQAELQRQQAEQQATQLRERLRQELSTIFETRETARGLISNISDVLFGTGKYTLTPTAREKLAKVSGILLAYPGLKVRLEGHTDDVGNAEYNQQLSQQRADAVRNYVIAQGVPAANLTAVGLGESDPIAPNETAAGRQQNRRVEMVVSGAPIGIGGVPPQQQ